MSDQGKQETWREWSAPRRPAPRLITRDELIETLERWGVKTARGRPIEEGTLRHWASQGLIPMASTEGDSGYERALYPWWVADLIKQLRHFQDGRMKTEQLRSWIRGEAYRLSRIPDWRVPESPQGSAEVPDVPMPLPREFSQEMIPPLARMMYQHRKERGIRFDRAEIRLVTTSGETLVYTVSVRPMLNESPEGEVQ